MKVFLVNGSPHQHGCTDRALREVASALEQGGIETEIFWIGSQAHRRLHRLRRVRKAGPLRLRRRRERICRKTR